MGAAATPAQRTQPSNPDTFTFVGVMAQLRARTEWLRDALLAHGYPDASARVGAWLAVQDSYPRHFSPSSMTISEALLFAEARARTRDPWLADICSHVCLGTPLSDDLLARLPSAPWGLEAFGLAWSDPLLGWHIPQQAADPRLGCPVMSWDWERHALDVAFARAPGPSEANRHPAGDKVILWSTAAPEAGRGLVEAVNDGISLMQRPLPEVAALHHLLVSGPG